MEKRKRLIGAKRTHRGKLEVRSVWGNEESFALANCCLMMGYEDLGKFVHDLAHTTLTEMLKQALEKSNGNKSEGSEVGSSLPPEAESQEPQQA